MFLAGVDESVSAICMQAACLESLTLTPASGWRVEEYLPGKTDEARASLLGTACGENVALEFG